jgi:hypothetical protein
MEPVVPGLSLNQHQKKSLAVALTAPISPTKKTSNTFANKPNASLRSFGSIRNTPKI